MPSLEEIRGLVYGGGYLGLDSQGRLANVGHFQQREVTLAGQPASGERSAAAISENRAVIDQVIDAIASHSQYGTELSRSARTHLGEHIATGKPLGKREIDQVLSQLDGQVSSRRASNIAMAERFSNPLGDHQGTEPNINSEWDRIKRTRNGDHLPGIDPSNDFCDIAMSAISSRIRVLGNDGKHEVTEAEAQQIAEAELTPLVELVAMNEILEASPLDNSEKSMLRWEIMNDPTLNRGNIGHRANVVRMNRLVNNPHILRSKASDAFKQANLSGDAAKFRLRGDLKEAMEAELQRAYGEVIPSGFHLEDSLLGKLNDYASDRRRLQNFVHYYLRLNPAAEHAVNNMILADPSIETVEQLLDLVNGKEHLLDHVVRKYPDSGVERQVTLCGLVLTDPSFSSREAIDAAVRATPACLAFYNAASSAHSTNNLSNAYVRYQIRFGNYIHCYPTWGQQQTLHRAAL